MTRWRSQILGAVGGLAWTVGAAAPASPRPSPASPWAGRLVTLQSECDAAKLTTCTVLGLLYYRGIVVPEDQDRAAALWTKACEGGDTLACFWQGDLVYRRRLSQPGRTPGAAALEAASKEAEAAGKPLHARWRELARQKCAQGSGVSCEGVARDLLQPSMPGVLPDPAAAVPFFQRASELVKKGCDTGDREDCARLRSYLLYGSGAPPGVGIAVDVPRGVELTKQACKAGDAWACGEWAGLNHRAGRRGQRSELSEPDILKLHLKACDAGQISDCREAATMLKSGSAGPQDLKAARRLYEQVCFEIAEDCEELVEPSPTP